MAGRSWRGLALFVAVGLGCGGGGGTAPSNGGGATDAGQGADGGTPPPGKRALAIVKSGSGNIRSNPAGIDCGSACSAAYDPGSMVSLSVSADAGWMFVGWSGACGGQGACTVTLTSDVAVYATFQTSAPPGSHKLTVARAGDGAGHVGSSPAGIDCGTACAASFSGSPSVTLSATAEAGSQFSSWSGGCTGAASCTVTVDRDVAVTATFAKKPPPPPADECAGFAPATPGTPTVLQTPPGRLNGSCLPGRADGNGNVAFGFTRLGYETFVELASSSGIRRGSQPFFANVDLIGQLDGFEGVERAFEGSDLVVLAPDGTIRKSGKANCGDGPNQEPCDSTSVGGWDFANDPTGGVIVLDGYMRPPLLVAFDAAGNVRWRLQVVGGPFGVDRQGNTLMLLAAFFGPGTTGGQWVDHAGHAGPIFDAKLSPQAFALYPRVGSGLFVLAPAPANRAVHDTWVGQLDALSTKGASPPPAWLATRQDTKIAMAHNGRAYALLPSQSQSSAPDCSQTIEVLAASGKSCGTAKFTVSPTPCTTQSIDVGYDGTVLQQLPTELEQPSSCTMRWWTGFLR